MYWGRIVQTLLGMMALVFLICLGVKWLEKKFPDDQFDERQKIARGKAYRLSDWTGEIYFLLLALYLITQDGGEGGIATYVLIFLGVSLKTLVFRVYFVLTHSDIPLGKKPYLRIMLRLSVGILALVSSYRVKSLESGASGAIGGAGAINVVMGISFISLAAIDILHILWENKE